MKIDLNAAAVYNTFMDTYRKKCPKAVDECGSALMEKALAMTPSKASMTAIVQDIIKAPSTFRFTYEPVQVDETKYYLTVDGAYKLYIEHMKRGTNIKLAWSLSCSYLMALLGYTLLQIPIEGIDLQYDIDQSFRSPIWFLVKNHAIGMLQFISSLAIGATVPYALYVCSWITISTLVALVKHIGRLTFFSSNDVQIVTHQGV